ncbi:MAG TPA: hypothetical protein VGY76_09290 [Solirubrobacteraceae bacterium]|jgi:hypothetical protein|nr:hypothetical protein [Solirubrobacteraceae bacterium]
MLAALDTLAPHRGQSRHRGEGGSDASAAALSGLRSNCSRMRANSARVATSERDTTPNRRPSIMIDKRATSTSGTVTSTITISNPITGKRVSAPGHHRGDQGCQDRNDNNHNQYDQP